PFSFVVARRISPYTELEYHFIQDMKTWGEAQSYCRTHYKDLTRIHSPEQLQEIQREIGNMYVWIGLYRDEWLWSNRDPALFQDWGQGQPNNGGNKESCAGLWLDNNRDSKWNDFRCTRSFPFLCYQGNSVIVGKYVLVEKNLTWDRAQDYCQSHYRDLISVSSSQEIKTLISQLQDLSAWLVWIGLQRNPNNNTLLWSSGDPVNFTNWSPGQPNNAYGSQHCAAILYNSSRWHDTSCTENRSFVCSSDNHSTGRQYHFIEEKKTWFEALEICRENYTDLVSVRSQKELEERITSLWIGLYCNVWQWSNGDPAPFQNWNTGEPDNGNNENCVDMRIRNPSTGKWKDSRCSEETSFLCSQVKHINQSKYILVKENKTWIEALNYCRANHTDLTSIPNPTAQEEITELANTSSGGGGIWIGLHRDQLLSFWFWMDDDESEYSNWGDGNKGDPFSDHCGMIDKEENFTWRFECCSTKLNFVTNLFALICTQTKAKREYHISSEMRSWFEALEICRRDYTDLTSIHSPEQLQEIQREIGNMYVWIGLYRDEWLWSNGDPALFQDWGQGQPNNSGNKESCAGLWFNWNRDGKWNDFPCSYSLPFFCYQETLLIVGKYVLVEKNLTWDRAQDYCRFHYRDLISVNSSQEIKTLISQLQDLSAWLVWIGLRRNPNNNTLLWSSGDPVNFTNWSPGQPNNAYDSQHCAAILYNSSRWHDTSCTENRSFVCFSETPNSAGRQYHFIQEEKTWFEALEICRENYTDLVSVHSQQEMEKIRNVSGTIQFWIGLYHNVWQWSNGDPAPFQNWNTGEPNNVGNAENCVGMRIRNPGVGKWNDSRCSEETYFLCYRGNRNIDLFYLIYKKSFLSISKCLSIYLDRQTLNNPKRYQDDTGGGDKIYSDGHSGGGVWIGLRRDRLLGFWFWMDDDESEYSNWGDGSKGDPLSDHCGMIDKEENFTWRFECCSTKLNFICY
uniref:C-type lectin domain-containing protein n=1 Tax=Latimeria chalumnae TaxID=7897 RepID=H3A5Y0_LATCH